MNEDNFTKEAAELKEFFNKMVAQLEVAQRFLLAQQQEIVDLKHNVGFLMALHTGQQKGDDDDN